MNTNTYLAFVSALPDSSHRQTHAHMQDSPANLGQTMLGTSMPSILLALSAGRE